jgi:hypothetical protein
MVSLLVWESITVTPVCHEYTSAHLTPITTTPMTSCPPDALIVDVSAVIYILVLAGVIDSQSKTIITMVCFSCNGIIHSVTVPSQQYCITSEDA